MTNRRKHTRDKNMMYFVKDHIFYFQLTIQ